MARIVPERWPALLGAVATAATVICGYALLVKVFPATLDPNDLVGRLKAPFGYWNATGLRPRSVCRPASGPARAPSDGRVLRALSIPALSILLAVLVLSYSRGALIAAIVACAAWFVLTPMRLRAALVLGLGALGAAVLALWAFAHHPLTHDNVALAARTHAGHVFGIVVLAGLADHDRGRLCGHRCAGPRRAAGRGSPAHRHGHGGGRCARPSGRCSGNRGVVAWPDRRGLAPVALAYERQHRRDPESRPPRTALQQSPALLAARGSKSASMRCSREPARAAF